MAGKIDDVDRKTNAGETRERHQLEDSDHGRAQRLQRKSECGGSGTNLA